MGRWSGPKRTSIDRVTSDAVGGKETFSATAKRSNRQTNSGPWVAIPLNSVEQTQGLVRSRPKDWHTQWYEGKLPGAFINEFQVLDLSLANPAAPPLVQTQDETSDTKDLIGALYCVCMLVGDAESRAIVPESSDDFELRQTDKRSSRWIPDQRERTESENRKDEFERSGVHSQLTCRRNAP